MTDIKNGPDISGSFLVLLSFVLYGLESAYFDSAVGRVEAGEQTYAGGKQHSHAVQPQRYDGEVGRSVADTAVACQQYVQQRRESVAYRDAGDAAEL